MRNTRHETGDTARQLTGPGTRLLRLWLAAAPLAMLALAVLFAVLAAGEERWGLVGAMVVLALVAAGLFAVQRWALNKYTADRRDR
ncbi:MAG: hypothetical protein HYS09_01025 [Chloroflexi bacterium]|nr:hypothetical protein [Chloroflexota bacterium]